MNKHKEFEMLCRDVALFLAILLASYNLATRTTGLEAKVQHLERAQRLYHEQYNDAAEILPKRLEKELDELLAEAIR